MVEWWSGQYGRKLDDAKADFRRVSRQVEQTPDRRIMIVDSFRQWVQMSTD